MPHQWLAVAAGGELATLSGFSEREVKLNVHEGPSEVVGRKRISNHEEAFVLRKMKMSTLQEGPGQYYLLYAGSITKHPSF